MSVLVLTTPTVPAMTSDEIEKVRGLETEALKMPQVDIETIHTLHAGTYSRTIMIPAGVCLTGALIKIPTTLIVSGHCKVFIGKQVVEIQGYQVIPASANRKQVFVTFADTWLTMMFATDAGTVEEAEEQFTDEIDLLGSRKEDNICQVIQPL